MEKYNIRYDKNIKFIHDDKRILLSNFKYVDNVWNDSIVTFRMYENKNIKNELSESQLKDFKPFPAISLSSELYFDDMGFGKSFYVANLKYKKDYVEVTALDWLSLYKKLPINRLLNDRIGFGKVNLGRLIKELMDALKATFENTKWDYVNYYDDINLEETYIGQYTEDLRERENSFGEETLGSVLEKFRNIFDFEYRTYSIVMDDKYTTKYRITFRKRLQGYNEITLKEDENIVDIEYNINHYNLCNNVTIITNNGEMKHNITNDDSVYKYFTSSAEPIKRYDLNLDRPINRWYEYEMLRDDVNGKYNFNYETINNDTREFVRIIENTLKLEPDIDVNVKIVKLNNKILIGDKVTIEYDKIKDIDGKEFRITEVTKVIKNGDLIVDNIILTNYDYWKPNKTFQRKFKELDDKINVINKNLLFENTSHNNVLHNVDGVYDRSRYAVDGLYDYTRVGIKSFYDKEAFDTAGIYTGLLLGNNSDFNIYRNSQSLAYKIPTIDGNPLPNMSEKQWKETYWKDGKKEQVINGSKYLLVLQNNGNMLLNGNIEIADFDNFTTSERTILRNNYVSLAGGRLNILSNINNNDGYLGNIFFNSSLIKLSNSEIVYRYKGKGEERNLLEIMEQLIKDNEFLKKEVKRLESKIDGVEKTLSARIERLEKRK